jgi:hypothetical protein
MLVLVLVITGTTSTSTSTHFASAGAAGAAGTVVASAAGAQDPNHDHLLVLGYGTEQRISPLSTLLTHEVRESYTRLLRSERDHRVDPGRPAG